MRNCLVQLAISNHYDCHFNFQSHKWFAKPIRRESEDYLSVIDHTNPSNCVEY